jgi:hypothetical protein
MPELADILDAQSDVYAANVDAWAAEERRFHGGYPMLVELERFTNETDPSYTSRKRQAPLHNFGKIHASIVVGHLNEVAPTPNYGTLGEVRERKAIPRGQETLAELFHYNANGVGTNGLTFTALSSSIQMRTLATGVRFTLVEMPKRRTRSGKVVSEDRPITQEDVRNGHRPFIAEYSPRDVPMYEQQDGRTDWAVVRTRWQPSEWTPNAAHEKGYYLLVREGFAGLGDQFAQGGWWLFDPRKAQTAEGRWSRTRGEIPLTMYAADESEGTDEWPSYASMPLMELNQLSSGLMNRISERNWNARNAAKSLKHVLGAEPQGFNEAMEMSLAGGMYVPWRPFIGPDGRVVIPSIYDGANGAVESSVYAEIIRSTIEEAHEIMVRQMTSTPDSSGRSKEAGFNEATAPIVSGLVTRRESWENTVIPWVEMRSGSEQPSGFVSYPDEIDLTPVRDKINAWYEMAIKVGARSPTVEAIGVEKLAQESGIWPDKEAEAVQARDELTRSIAGTIAGASSESMVRMTQSGASLEGSAEMLGFTPEQVTTLVGGGPDGSIDQANPDAAVVVSGAGPSEAEGTADVGGVSTGNRPANAGPPTSQPAPNVVQDTGRATGSPLAERPTPARNIGIARATEPPPAPAPSVDLSDITSRIDALAELVAALVSAMASQRQEPAPAPQPAPVIVPIMMPQQTAGKTVTVTTPDNRAFTVNVEPTPVPENGTQPLTRD